MNDRRIGFAIGHVDGNTDESSLSTLLGNMALTSDDHGSHSSGLPKPSRSHSRTASGMIDVAGITTDLSVESRAIAHNVPASNVSSTIGSCFKVAEKPARICQYSISYSSIGVNNLVKNRSLKRQLLTKTLEKLAQSSGLKPVAYGFNTVYSLKPVHPDLQAAPSETHFDIVHQQPFFEEPITYRVRVKRQQDIKFDDVAKCLTSGKLNGVGKCLVEDYVRALNALLQSALIQSVDWVWVNRNLCISKIPLGEDAEPKPQQKRAMSPQLIRHIKLHEGIGFFISFVRDDRCSTLEPQSSPCKLALTASPRPTLCVEGCNLADFYEDYIKDGGDQINNKNEDFHSYLRKLDVVLGYKPSRGTGVTMHIKKPQATYDLPQDARRRMISSIGESAVDQRFQYIDDGRIEDISVGSYFEKYNGYKLRHPYLPVANVGAGPKDFDSEIKSEIWIPMELLWVQEQPLFKFPPLLAEDAVKSVQRMSEESIRSFEAKVADKGDKVAQLLNPIVLRDLVGITLEPIAQDIKGYFFGSWPCSSQEKPRIKAPQFIESPQLIQFLTLRSGPYAHTKKERERFETGYQMLLEAFRVEGALRDRQPTIYDYDIFGSAPGYIDNLGPYFERYCQQKKYLLFVGLEGPRKARSDVHKAIRRWCDKNNIPVIFLDARTLQRIMRPWERSDRMTDVQIRHALAYARALITKSVHRYTGGIPNTHAISPRDAEHLKGPLADTMVIGASLVSTGVGTSDDLPSVAAVTANVEDNFVQYQGRFRIQSPEDKKIAGLGAMLREMLLEYALAHDNRLPRSMLYFREGVSQSHFDMVRSGEVRNIADAYNKLCEDEPRLVAPDSVPRITFVALSKRAKPRFFPARCDVEKETSKNLKAGAVVDGPEFQRSSVERPGFEFYLQSHTNRCDSDKQCGFTSNTHYFVLQHENSWTAEELEDITNRLCHMNAVPGADSCVTPVYYSGKICQRARSYVRALAPCEHASLSWGQMIERVEKSSEWPESHVLGKKMFWL